MYPVRGNKESTRTYLPDLKDTNNLIELARHKMVGELSVKRQAMRMFNFRMMMMMHVHRGCVWIHSLILLLNDISFKNGLN